MSLPRPRIIPDFDPFPMTSPAPPGLAAGIVGGLPPPAGLVNCTACSARQDALRVVPGEGPADAQVCFLGQNPGEEEDLAARPFVGLSGAELDRWLAILGFDRAKVFITNVVKCHTTNNRAPRAAEIQTCSFRWLVEEFGALSALRVIVPLGKPAAERLLGKSAPSLTPLGIHHIKILLLGREMSVFPLPHPAFLLRAQHLGPTFRDILLPQVRETLQSELPSVYDACRRH